MDTIDRRILLTELLDERDKLTRLWDAVRARPEKTLQELKSLHEAHRAWERLYKRFVAEVIENCG